MIRGVIVSHSSSGVVIRYDTYLPITKYWAKNCERFPLSRQIEAQARAQALQERQIYSA